MDMRPIHRIALLATLALAASACSSTPGHDAPQDAAAGPSYLFVQNCTAGTLLGNTLTLQNVGPTLYFTDRPYRVEGHVRTNRLVDNWGEGDDSFAANPPNAVLSVLGGSEVQNATLVLSEPRLVGSTLTYTVAKTEGAVPASFSEASLFIDSYRGGAYRGSVYHGGGYYHRYGRRPVVVEGGDQQFINLGETGPKPPHVGL